MANRTTFDDRVGKHRSFNAFSADYFGTLSVPERLVKMAMTTAIGETPADFLDP
jgi:hypothetical protein